VWFLGSVGVCGTMLAGTKKGRVKTGRRCMMNVTVNWKMDIVKMDKVKMDGDDDE